LFAISNTTHKKGISVATPTTCVALKCKADDLFDKALKPDILEQMKKTIQPLVDGTKGLKFDPKCTDGWELTASVSLTADDPKNPKTIEAKVAINGLHLQGTTKAFKSSGGAKGSGFSARNIAKYAKLAVHDALEDVMKKRVIPQMAP
jgi:hypothetical protein